MGAVCFFVFLSNYVTVSLSPILVSIITDFNISVDQAGYLITLNLLFLGLGNLFWVPLSERMGKRPVLIACALTYFVCSIWAAVAKTYGSFLGARIMQGFGASASEALGPAVVADLYFVHERGLFMSFYLLIFTVGVSLGGIWSGLIASSTPNWHWVLWHDTILTGFVFLVIVLFAPETNFKRPPENESGEGMPLPELVDLRKRVKFSWIRSLSVTTWYDREFSIWWLWWRPWLTLRLPAVWFCIITYGVSLGWQIIQTTANGVIFPAIYNFSPRGVGNISCAYLVASFLGCAAGGPFLDWLTRYITKRRGGYFVPEYRLWAMIPPSVVFPIGLLMYGGGLENHLNYMIPIVGSAIGYAVVCVVPSVGMTYVVDCYRPLSGETMTMVTAAKNTFGFALSFAVFPWLERDGYLKASGIQVLIQAILFLTTIPMYIYGAMLRQWTSKFLI
ncbi:uncharacterized protein Z519_01324 [Cladophialophora bantiana CBS 173.52]|uniref:Major facilitator superfamily (MFS) profile domain-containing protein n=1 Tax=Cladophialophora bantiana (strain ATCC 10958 / CBS 173.52 / CDC B-1940 / NIH 8579) TaxID=1442370 RepID=A0A0D2I3F1_CLAB1|nr:uncharacterized protein Z519_01324 [Cladophialophora bantiana CBS 173.52]KIW97740.1 hypothetical protein Z519_01324 [Cladophialophora bantiana CBS 173.52]